MSELLYKGRSLNTAPEDVCVENEARNMRVGDVGGKNLIRQTAQNHSVNGITVSTNSDMSIYAKGTVTSSVYNRSIGNTITLTPGTYTLSGCPSGGSTSTYRLCIMTVSDYTIIASDIGNSVTFSVDDTNDYYVCIRVEVGKTVDGTFYPMLVEGAEAQSYERYVPSMATLNNNIVSLNDSLTTHTHDERYYTEAEVSAALNKKADKSTSFGIKKIGECSTVGTWANSYISGIDTQKPILIGVIQNSNHYVCSVFTISEILSNCNSSLPFQVFHDSNICTQFYLSGATLCVFNYTGYKIVVWQ